MHSSKTTKKLKKDNFFYGYIVLTACFLTMMVAYGAQNSFGVFLKPILTEFGWTRATTAAAFSLNFALFGIFSFMTGRLCDRFGPRPIVTISGILVAGSYLLMSQINSIWQIYLIYGILLSLGVAGINIPLLSTIARWFNEKRGIASGITYAGIGVGIIVMPPLANFLISSYNWRISFMIIGLIALTIPVIAQFLKRAPGHLKITIDDSGEAQHEQPSLNQLGFSLRQAIHTRQFWLISALLFIMNLCLQSVMVHLIAYATDAGISASIAVTIISVIGIASTISKVGIGSAIDRFRTKRIWVMVSVLMLLSFLLLAVAHELWILYIFAVIYAIGYGGWSTAQSVSVAEYFGLRAHGAIFGLAASVACIGGAAGPYFTGLVFDITGSYYWAFMGCAATGAIAIILSILLKPTSNTLDAAA